MAFTNPFRYFPAPLVVKAAEEVMEHIDGSQELRDAFSEGKMLGILLVEVPESQHLIPDLTRNLHRSGNLRYIAAFSGSAGGRSIIEGFVPPIFDLLDPSGHFKIREAEITAINQKILFRETSSHLSSLKQKLADAERDRDEEIGLMKAGMAISKRERDEIRMEVSDSSRMAGLIRESQFEKAELRRLKISWEERISGLKEEINSLTDDIKALKALRAKKSDELQDWIFRQYIVHNALGEESSILDIFAREGLMPPGGTGDCAAPKLLGYAFRNGLKPIEMGEFWYGKSPETAVRTHGHFYPSCTSKCGPLLGWMMRGMEISDDTGHVGCSCDEHCCPPSNQSGTDGRNGHGLSIIYEDDILIAIDKPSGMPSVPGLNGRISAYEILQKSVGELFVVHRLDMDTSGILLFAKTQETAAEIQKQFENHTIRKTYKARLSAEGSGLEVGGELENKVHGTDATGKRRMKVGDRGRIELPLSPDYDERPRQKVDFVQGKEAVTDYEVVGLSEDGCLDVLFFPLTGRTHQLRVHAAHALGLARPILGDPLYGGSPASRLHLHAVSIAFRHPITAREVCINLQ